MYSEEEEIEQYNGEEEEIKLTRKRKKRTQDFSNDDKKKLAVLVRKSDHIWNFSNVLHNNANALDKSWTEISKQLDKPKETCKRAWISLRESYRYHTKASKKNQNDPLNQNKLKWDLTEDLAFLSDAKRPQRRIYPNLILNGSEQNKTVSNGDDQDQNEVNEYMDPEEEEPSNSSLPSISDYGENFEDELDGVQYKNGFYNKSSDNIEAGKLLQQLNVLAKAQTDFMRYFRINDTGNLNYRTQLIACDALLRQLPTTTAETTLVEIQNYILKKINDYQKNKIEN